MASEASFAFVQFEFGFALGPADGRYLTQPVTEGGSRLVIVLRTLGAPQRRLLGRRRPRAVQRVDPEPVPTSRASVIGAEPFESNDAADEWLGKLRADEDALRPAVERAAGDLNRVIRVHRAVAADPYARDVSPDGALTVRVGYGRGEQVADGRFAVAYEVPRRDPRRRRVERLSPQEHLAAVLAGREEVLACEEIVLRARADIEAGRSREAALQARIALECVLSELAGRLPGEALAELAGDRETVSAAGNAALEADPPEHLEPAVEAAVGRMEAAIRRHRLSPPGEASAR